jgi:hypothetical protein
MAAAHDLPVRVDPRYSRQTGADILSHGLPDLPEVLSYDMALPVAYWRTDSCGAVLFLSFDAFGGATPAATIGTYRRDFDGWVAKAAWAVVGWSHDPVKGGSYEDFEGSSIVVSGTNISADPESVYPGLVAIGHVAKEVDVIAVTQGGHETRHHLDSYFGAWIICCQQAAPYRVAGFDAQGNIIGHVDERC